MTDQIYRKVIFKVTAVCYIYFVCINSVDEKRHRWVHIEVLQKIIMSQNGAHIHFQQMPYSLLYISFLCLGEYTPLIYIFYLHVTLNI